MQPLRPLVPTDLDELIEVYSDAVLSQTPGLYTPRQVAAWAGHAARSADVAAALMRGHGLASLSRPGGSIEAFGLLDPIDRLSLLYCRGRSCRQGRSRQLLAALQAEASRQGCTRLRTEASQLSRPLLLRLGWQVEAEEEVLFAAVPFVRWRMVRSLP